MAARTAAVVVTLANWKDRTTDFTDLTDLYPKRLFWVHFFLIRPRIERIMDTAREIFDHYIPQLIMKMRDPRPAMQFCEQFNSAHTKMADLTKNIPDHRVRELWNMVIHSNFKEDPNPLIKEMNGKVRELKEQGKI
jgi:hypothetical protein